MKRTSWDDRKTDRTVGLSAHSEVGKDGGSKTGIWGRISINSRARRPAAESKKIREIENRNSSIIINNLHLSLPYLLPFYYRLPQTSY